MKIVVYLHGGLVQQIALANIPPALERLLRRVRLVAEIRDYDIEGAEEDELQKDDMGNEFVGHEEEVIW